MTALAHGDVAATPEAHVPPEARGLRRDGVRLLVAGPGPGALRHARFADLPRVLCAGDLLVVNTSATLPAVKAMSAGSKTWACTREYVPTVVGRAAWKALPVGAGLGTMVGDGAGWVTVTPGTSAASGLLSRA